MSEVSDLKIQQAREVGADRVINPKESSPLTARGSPYNLVIDAVHKLGEGVDIAFDASGLQATLDIAIASVKPGGMIFNVAIHEKLLLLYLNELSVGEKRLTGGICYIKKDFGEVLSQLASNSIAAD